MSEHLWRATGRQRALSLAERIAEKTDTSGGPDACHPWRGAKNSRGRAVVQIHGRAVYVTRHLLAQSLGRPLEAGEFACHTCDNPPCVNLAHLFAGDHAANMSDMAAKGRASRLPKSAEQRAKAGASISAYWKAHPDESPSRRKTHCPQGHPYSGENLILRKGGTHRRCRICVRETQRRASARRRST